MYNHFLGFPHLQAGPNSIELTSKPNMTFNLTPTAQDFPRWNNWLTWGSRELRWDIFDGDYNETDWTYPPVIGENHCMFDSTTNILRLCRLFRLGHGSHIANPRQTSELPQAGTAPTVPLILIPVGIARMISTPSLYITCPVEIGRDTGGLADMPMGQRSYLANTSKLNAEPD